MRRITVPLGERSYDVLIEAGLLDRVADHLTPFARGGRLIVVSDENVWRAQGERLMRGLRPLRADPILVPPGEASKSWSGLASLVDALLARGLERGDHLVAFGGGIVGDLAGFAAAIVKRGCGLIQIPTSLLAQVDSSVGGKTGINVDAGKNMVGAFLQPALVLIDSDCLATLDPRHVRAGYAEVLKYALIEDTAFFDWLDAHGSEMIELRTEKLAHAIAVSVAGKAAIVGQDERETGGRRALLNLGHTFGHALEAEFGFSDRLLHGEAVASGLVLAFRFSAARGLCPASDADRVTQHLRRIGLPTAIEASAASLIAHMRQDKKAEGGRIPFILARGVGQAFVDRSVELEQVEAFLSIPA